METRSFFKKEIPSLYWNSHRLCNFQLEPELLAKCKICLLLHKSVKTFPSALAKIVASFIKLDTIPRHFPLSFEEKIDEFTNNLSFVSPEKVSAKR